MLIIYPAVFHRENDSYWAEFPDLEGCQTYGDTLEETLISAQEALEAYASTLLEQGQKLCPASDIKTLKVEGDTFASLISCNLNNCFKKSKSVKKTLTVPQWLDDMALKEGINFSQTLQNALMEQLHISQQ